MTPEEVETFPALPEIDHPGLVRVQFQPQPASRSRAAAERRSACCRERHITTKSSA